MSGIKENLAMMNLAMELFSGKTGNISKVDYDPQKVKAPAFPPEYLPYFERVSPESVGIDSGYISGLVNDLSSCKKAAPHHLICLRHGKVFLECTWAPYVKGIFHIEHSLAKSITSLAIGILVDDGKLSVDTRLTEIFGSDISFINSIKCRNISVHNLLTMTSGIAFNEGGAISGNDWAASFFDSPLNFNTGTAFEYNSMNSYMLSAIVTKITGVPMDEFLKERLFTPMHITQYLWERCPKGITKGGWGLFMTPEDVAKIGCLYQSGGVFEGSRLISEEWLIEAKKKQVSCNRSDGLDYGYQLWVDEKNGSCLLNGMLQQNCFMFDEKDIVVVTNSGSDELMTVSHVADMVNSYFGEGVSFEDKLEENPYAHERLVSVCANAGHRKGKNRILKGGWNRKKTDPLGGKKESFLQKIDARSYLLENTSEGLMPIFMQMVHNNFTEGLCEISFERDPEGIFIDLKEKDTVHHLAAGFENDRYTTLDFKGEQYLLAAYARFAFDETGDPCLLLEVTFVEEACKRLIKIFFEDSYKRIRLELSEIPGQDVIMSVLNMVSDSENGIIMNKIRELGAIEIFNRAAITRISPVIRGHLMDSYDKIGENVLWARP